VLEEGDSQLAISFDLRLNAKGQIRVDLLPRAVQFPLAFRGVWRVRAANHGGTAILVATMTTVLSTGFRMDCRLSRIVIDFENVHLCANASIQARAQRMGHVTVEKHVRKEGKKQSMDSRSEVGSKGKRRERPRIRCALIGGTSNWTCRTLDPASP
jgi:hypothetical protein